jgi:hypothetical protein
MKKAERGWRPPPSARDLIEQRLEPGEPIEALIRLAASGPALDTRSATALGIVGLLSLAGSAVQHMSRTAAIAVTDRRVFFVRGATPTGMRIEPRAAVRVLEYDSSGPWLRLWLNVGGQQSGYRIWQGYRAATDALVHALGGPPPSP